MKKSLRRPLLIVAATAAFSAACNHAEVQPAERNDSLSAATFDCQAEAQTVKPLPKRTAEAVSKIAGILMKCHGMAPQDQKFAEEGSYQFDVRVADGGVMQFYAREDVHNPGPFIDIGAAAYPNGDTKQSPSEQVTLSLLPGGKYWGMHETNNTRGGPVVTDVILETPMHGAPAQLVRTEASGDRHVAKLLLPDAVTQLAAERVLDMMDIGVAGASNVDFSPIGS